MKQRQKNPGQGGYTIIEVLIAMAVLVIASKQTVESRLKAEANEHAIQMLEELRSVVINNNVAITVLDNYGDTRDTLTNNPIYRYTLTTQKEITQDTFGNPVPDNASAINRLSGNPLSPNGFTFVRRVEISKDITDPNLRKIHVTVWAAAPNPGPPPAAMGTAIPLNVSQPMAEMFGIVRSLAAGTTPSQVLDVYLIALESVPGWWSRTSELIPLMRSSMISLQASNPGLVLRPHWIVRMSYGRDAEYTPEVNAAVEAQTAGAFKKTYIYPGLITYTEGQDDYFLPTWFKARVNADSAMDYNDGYAIADQWNHAMRLPDENNLFAIHQQVNLNAGLAAPEVSLRMMLDNMNSLNSGARALMTNAIIINMHGEMLPVPPLRNYSDAAKDPAYYWGGRGGSLTNRAWRAVTHAERLAYSRNGASGITNTVALRVYAYDMNTLADPITPSAEDDLVDTITLFVPGANTGNVGSVSRMRGNSRYSYYWISQTASTFGSIVTGALNTTGTTNFDGTGSLAASVWVADNYTPPGRSATPGLRIRLYGTTPTARVFHGSPN
jgi:prepilin-type N-terminal cleavage/methylation domain-containing protein